MFRTRKLLILAAAMLGLLALLAAACGGDDDNDGGSDGESEPTATQAAEDNGDGEEATAQPTEDGGGDSSDGAEEEDTAAVLGRFRQAAENLETSTFHVVYEMQSASMDGTFTLASKPPDSLVGIEGTFDGEEGTMLIVTKEDFLYFCTDSTGEQGCIKMKSGDTSAFPLPTLIDVGDIVASAASVPGAEVKKVDGEEIAGIDADCYEYSSGSDEGKICVGDDQLLLMQGTFSGQQVSLRVQEITTDPGKVEIEVPDWPVTDLSNVGY